MQRRLAYSERAAGVLNGGTLVAGLPLRKQPLASAVSAAEPAPRRAPEASADGRSAAFESDCGANTRHRPRS
jgi:hypothetical protein